jgi:hypothetical protein
MLSGKRRGSPQYENYIEQILRSVMNRTLCSAVNRDLHSAGNKDLSSMMNRALHSVVKRSYAVREYFEIFYGRGM